MREVSASLAEAEWNAAQAVLKDARNTSYSSAVLTLRASVSDPADLRSGTRSMIKELTALEITADMFPQKPRPKRSVPNLAKVEKI